MNYVKDDLLSDLTKVDQTPADNSCMTTLEQLRSLAAGDLVHTPDGGRYRVQKHLTHGIRLRDNDGARNFTFDQLMDMGLQKAERDAKGPAARRLGELRTECEKYGIDCTALVSTKDFEIALGDHFATQSGADVLDQIGPQLASDAKDLQDYATKKPWLGVRMNQFWDDPKWIAEEKLDGVRLKLHITLQGCRVDSRRRDTKTRRFSEKTANFPHIQALNIPELYGTVLDCEAMLNVKSGTSPVSNKPFYGSLSISTACTNAGPDSARLIQDEFGPMQLHVFDVLKIKGKDATHFTAQERRHATERIVNHIWKNYAVRDWLLLTRQSGLTRDEKVEFFESIIQEGGEGVIFKKQDAPYQVDKRSRSWMKLKRFVEIDAYITGYIPGEHGYTGLVGALELAVRINGKDVGIAAVSQVELEERKEMSAADGSLKPEYYGRVITFRGQELTKNGRYRHAIFVSWREDKAKDDCDGYEIRTELAALKVI